MGLAGSSEGSEGSEGSIGDFSSAWWSHTRMLCEPEVRLLWEALARPLWAIFRFYAGGSSSSSPSPSSNTETSSALRSARGRGGARGGARREAREGAGRTFARAATSATTPASTTTGSTMGSGPGEGAGEGAGEGTGEGLGHRRSSLSVSRRDGGGGGGRGGVRRGGSPAHASAPTPTSAHPSPIGQQRSPLLSVPAHASSTRMSYSGWSRFASDLQLSSTGLHRYCTGYAARRNNKALSASS